MCDGEIDSVLGQTIKDAAAGHLAMREIARIADAIERHIEARYVTVEEASRLIVASRLEELRLVQTILKELCDADTLGEVDASDVLLRMLEHVADRRRVIKSIAARRAD